MPALVPACRPPRLSVPLSSSETPSCDRWSSRGPRAPTASSHESSSSCPPRISHRRLSTMQTPPARLHGVIQADPPEDDGAVNVYRHRRSSHQEIAHRKGNARSAIFGHVARGDPCTLRGARNSHRPRSDRLHSGCRGLIRPRHHPTVSQSGEDESAVTRAFVEALGFDAADQPFRTHDPRADR